jgi:hypothetical protein
MAGASPTPVSASRVDRASARTFLADAMTYVRISVSRRLELKTAVGRFIGHLESSCPSALAHAPPAIVEYPEGAPPPKGSGEGTPAHRTTSQTFLIVALGELKVVGYAPIRGPARAFAHELAQLHWTEPAIAHTLADFSQSILTTLALTPPDFCAAAQTSAARGFADAPPEATQFADNVRAASFVNEGRSLTSLATTMRPLLATGDLDTLARFRRLWSRAEPLLQIGDASAFRLLRVVFEPHR